MRISHHAYLIKRKTIYLILYEPIFNRMPPVISPIIKISIFADFDLTFGKIWRQNTRALLDAKMMSDDQL